MPLTAFFHHTHNHDLAEEVPVSPDISDTQRLLLDRFCTSPLPFIDAHGSEGREHHVVDPEAYMGGRTIDIATLHRQLGVVHPGTRPNDHDLDILLHASMPVRRLVMDIYVHRALVQQSVPFFGAFVLGFGIDLDLRKAWYRQIPEGGPLQMLGQGLKNAGSSAWNRQAELASHTFELLDANPDDAIGFRADILYPVWGMTYAIGFRFAEGTASPIQPS